MRHVICKLPNASENISGVAFARQADGSVKTVEPMEDAAAEAAFGGIPGYDFVDPDAKPAKPARATKEEMAAKAAAEAGVTLAAPVVQPEAAPAAEPIVPAAEAPAAV